MDIRRLRRSIGFKEAAKLPALEGQAVADARQPADEAKAMSLYWPALNVKVDLR